MKQYINLDNLVTLHKPRHFKSQRPEREVYFRLKQLQDDLMVKMIKLQVWDPLSFLGFWIAKNAQSVFNLATSSYFWIFKRFYLAERDLGLPAPDVQVFQSAHQVYNLEMYLRSDKRSKIDSLSKFKEGALEVIDSDMPAIPWFCNLKIRESPVTRQLTKRNQTQLDSSLIQFVDHFCIVVAGSCPLVSMEEFNNKYDSFCQFSSLSPEDTDPILLRTFFGFNFVFLRSNTFAIATHNIIKSAEDNPQIAFIPDNAFVFSKIQPGLPPTNPESKRIGLPPRDQPWLTTIEPIWPLSLRTFNHKDFPLNHSRETLGSVRFPIISRNVFTFGIILTYLLPFIFYDPLFAILDIWFIGFDIRRIYDFDGIEHPFRADQNINIHPRDPNFKDLDYFNAYKSIFIFTLCLPVFLFIQLALQQRAFRKNNRSIPSLIGMFILGLFYLFRRLISFIVFTCLLSYVTFGLLFSFIGIIYDWSFLSVFFNYSSLILLVAYYFLNRLSRRKRADIIAGNIEIDAQIKSIERLAILKRVENEFAKRLHLKTMSAATFSFSRSKIRLMQKMKLNRKGLQLHRTVTTSNIHENPPIHTAENPLEILEILLEERHVSDLTRTFFLALVKYSMMTEDVNKVALPLIDESFIRLIASLELPGHLSQQPVANLLVVARRYFNQMQQENWHEAAKVFSEIIRFAFSDTFGDTMVLLKFLSPIVHEFAFGLLSTWRRDTIHEFIVEAMSQLPDFDQLELTKRFSDSLNGLNWAVWEIKSNKSANFVLLAKMSNVFGFFNSWAVGQSSPELLTFRDAFSIPQWAKALPTSDVQTISEIIGTQNDTLSPGQRAFVTKLWAIGRGIEPNPLLDFYLDLDIRLKVKTFLHFGFGWVYRLSNLLSPLPGRACEKLVVQLLNKLGFLNPFDSYQLLYGCFQLGPNALEKTVKKHRPTLLPLVEEITSRRTTSGSNLYKVYDKRHPKLQTTVDRLFLELKYRNLSVQNWKRCMDGLSIRQNAHIGRFMKLVMALEMIVGDQQHDGPYRLVRFMARELNLPFPEAEKPTSVANVIRSFAKIRTIACIATSLADKLRLARRDLFTLGLRVKRLEDLLRCLTAVPTKKAKLKRNFGFMDLDWAQLSVLGEILDEKNQILGSAVHVNYKNSEKLLSYREKNSRILEAMAGEIFQVNSQPGRDGSGHTTGFWKAFALSKDKHFLDIWSIDALKSTTLESEDPVQRVYLEKKEVKRRVDYVMSKLAGPCTREVLRLYQTYLMYDMLGEHNKEIETVLLSVCLDAEPVRFEGWLGIQGSSETSQALLNEFLIKIYADPADRSFLEHNRKLQLGVTQLFTFSFTYFVHQLILKKPVSRDFMFSVFGDNRVVRFVNYLLRIKLNPAEADKVLDLGDEKHFQTRYRLKLTELRLLFDIRNAQVNYHETNHLLKSQVEDFVIEKLLTVLSFDNKQSTAQLFELIPGILHNSALFQNIGIDSYWSWMSLLMQKGELDLARKHIGSSGGFSMISRHHLLEELVMTLIEIRQVKAILDRNKHTFAPKIERRKQTMDELIEGFSPKLPITLQYNPNLFILLNCEDCGQ